MEPFIHCTDTTDLSELSLPQQLYLKPEARLSITVALPQVRLPGKTISNWEVMERLRSMLQPDEILVMKVSKSTLEFIRFDAEIENRSQLSHAIARLDGKTIKLSGFPESLKIRAAEAKPDFPSRHDWDKYFRDAKNMNEMKPGERPDTIYLQQLPSRWFVSKKDKRGGVETPNEYTLERVFEVFGEVRSVDIPMLDHYRNQMKTSISGIRTFSHVTGATFEAYVQYKEYICFLKAMDALRGMKLVHKDGVKAFSANIKVDFDKTKHLSDMSIRRRKLEREKLMAVEREKEEEKRREEETVKQALDAEKRRKAEEKKLKGERRKEREEKRKQKILKKLKKKEAEQMNIKIAIEERKLLMAQRKLESIRLLDELLERVKQEKQKEITKQKEEELDSQISKVRKKKEEKMRHKEVKEKQRKDDLMDKEKELRNKLVKKIKSQQEQQMEERREKLRKAIEGKSKMRSVLKPLGEVEETTGYQSTGVPYPPEYDPYDYGAVYDSYPGSSYGYSDWYGAPRGGYSSRRPYRGYRGGYSSYNDYYYYSQHPDTPKNSTPGSTALVKETGQTTAAADDMEDISSDSSSGTSKYSNLTSGSETKLKVAPVTESVEGTAAEAKPSEDGATSHPWVGYSDYYNPRFMRSRPPRRARGSFAPRRGSWGRGGYGFQPNPNVPMNSFYMQSINSQYYRYFKNLAHSKQEEPGYKSRSRSRSRSNSSERVVCRKVLSRSRSRSRRRSRSSSRSRSTSRSRSRSRRRSRSRATSRSRRSRSTRSRSRSKSKPKDSNVEVEKHLNDKKEEVKEESKVEHTEKKTKDEKKIKKEKKTKEKRKKKDVDKKRESEVKDIDEVSDLSLSLSASEGSGGSPARKARPLGDPGWEPDDVGRRRRDRPNSFISDRYMSYERSRDRYRDRYRYEGRTKERDRPPAVRSHVSKPDKSMESDDSRKNKEPKDAEKRKRKHHDKPSKKYKS